MIHGRRLVLALLLGLAALLLGVPTEGAEEARRRFEPWIGFVTPAGGQRGRVVRVDVGGQLLRSVQGAVLSGPGVRARLVRYVPPFRPLDREEAQELRRQLAEIRGRRMATTAGDGARADQPAAPTAPKEGEAPRARLPEHPLLENLASKSLAELKEVEDYFFRPRPLQETKRAIAETITLDVVIDAGAPLGVRDLRLLTPAGLTNPLPFHVGDLPEVQEHEPNDGTPRGQATMLPAVFNGQLLERDNDRFLFRARAGQGLVVRCEARRLVPYMADAVPGWMQAVLSIYDDQGREVAYADDYRFDPDPILFFTVPRDGDYVLEIRDAIFRGREDFTYRITAGELPFVTSLFPLGGRTGAPTIARLTGWNLPEDSLELDTRPGQGEIRPLPTNEDGRHLGDLASASHAWPARLEVEPNGDARSAQQVGQGVVVDGRIGAPGDVDVFAFEGRRGEEIVLDVRARVLGSPLDALVRLEDETGAVLAWNDDHPDRTLGFLTHHADPHLLLKLPASGTFYVRLTDACGHGGAAYAYRLRIGPPRPDFALLVSPSTINVPAARRVPVTVDVVRREGFDGEIELDLVDAPEGFVLEGRTVPAGQDRVRVTLKSPSEGAGQPVRFTVVGRAKIEKELVTREAVPTDDVMQAFIYRHLVPARELAVAIVGSGRGATVIPAPEGKPLRLRRGSREKLEIPYTGSLPAKEIRFELSDPPEGVSLASAKILPTRIRFEIEVDRKADVQGVAGNLIVEAHLDRELPRERGRRGPAQRQRAFLGVLPAIPFEIR